MSLFKAIFLKQFSSLSAGPDSILRLRQLVLNLAISGKLTSHLNTDGCAESLVHKAGESIEVAVSTGQLRKPRYFGSPFLFEPKGTLPKNWVWSTLGNLGVIAPRNDCEDGADAGFVPMAAIESSYGKSHGVEARYWADIKSGYTHIADGDVVLAKITPCFENGKSTVVSGLPGGVGAGTTELHVFRQVVPVVNPRYLLAFLKSGDFIQNGVPRMTGTAGQKRLPADYFASCPFPLPPLAEQDRIVAKVDELMMLCDTLEAQQDEETELKRAFAASALDYLTQAATASEAANQWERIASRFSELFDDVVTIKALRGSIADLAVRGCFSGGQPFDDAQLEVKQLRDHRLHRWANKRLPKKLALITPPEQNSSRPFSDESMQFVRLGELALSIDYGTSEKTSSTASDGVLTYGMGQIQDGLLTTKGAKYLNRSSPALPALYLKKNDILFNRTNSYALVGKAAVYLDDDDQHTFASYLIRLRLDLDFCEPRFISLYLNSPICRRTQIEPEITQQTNQANYNGTKLASVIVPFPPLAEQRRIVAKVDELMMQCARLEERILAGERLNAELLEALILRMTDSDPEGGSSSKADDNPGQSFSEEVRASNISDTFASGNVPIRMIARRAQASEESDLEPSHNGAEVDKKFKEAVLVGAIVKSFFANGGEPIGNFRLQKAVYFARRHNGEHALDQEFLRKAAGPYNPSMKYSGGIAVAKTKDWLREARGRFGFGHVPGANAREMDAWIIKYGFEGAARWVADNFRFKKNEEWETLATVDYVVEHMKSLGVDADPSKILTYIHADYEWSPKVQKLRLTETKIQLALFELNALFSDAAVEG